MPKHVERSSAWPLLLKHVHLGQNERVLVPYATAETPLPALLGMGASFVVVAPTVADLPALKAQVSRDNASRCRIVLDDATAFDGGPTFDAALLVTDAPAAHGNAFTIQLIRRTLISLRPGGMLWVSGSKRHGIETFGRELSEVAGTVALAAIGGGGRLLRATRPAALPAADVTAPPAIETTVRGLRLRVQLEPGVFAGQTLDEATALLIETMRIRPDDRVLDLGCGAGAIGLAAAMLAPRGQVTLLDATPAAVRLAAINAALNGLTNTEAVLSDAYGAVAGQRFDVIATNPPFHEHGRTSRVVAERFIREAPAHLRPRGRLYVVANAFLPYEAVARAVFGDVEVPATNARYKVLLCRGRPPRSTGR